MKPTIGRYSPRDFRNPLLGVSSIQNPVTGWLVWFAIRTATSLSALVTAGMLLLR